MPILNSATAANTFDTLAHNSLGTLAVFSETFANPIPSSIFHKEVSFTTVDEINGNPINEGYVVTGPTNTGITTIPIAGNKVVVPLSTSHSEGAPYLKFHLPTSTEKKMYLTFCVLNSNMGDGYYDYTTGIPDTYKNQLKTWITGPNVNANSTAVFTKSLKFTAYGASTNKPQEAVTFYINFQTQFAVVEVLNTNNNATFLDNSALL